MDVGRVLARVAFLVALLLSGSAVALPLGGTVTDPSGRPLPGATVHLAAMDTAARTDTDGMFSFPTAPPEDVLTAVAPGYAPRSLAVFAGAPPMEVVLSVAEPEGELVRFQRDTELPVDVRAFSIGLLGATATVPFSVNEGASGGTFNLSWTPESTQLMVNVVHVPTGASFGYLRAPSPMRSSLGSALLRDLPGPYVLEVSLFNGGGEAVTAHAEIEVTYGPWLAKTVQGKRPEVVHPSGTQATVEPRNANMDILAIRFTNETDDQVDVEMDLADLRATDTNGPLVSLWSVHWTTAGEQWAVFLRGDADGGGLEWYAGDCDPRNATCSLEYRLHGAVVRGSPGRITWHVPKSVIGNPADGTWLEQPFGLNFMLPAERTPVRRLPIMMDRSTMFVSDRTDPADGRAYTWGRGQYLGPALAAGRSLQESPLSGEVGGGIFLVVAMVLAGAWWRARSRPNAVSGVGPGGRYQPLRVIGTGASGRTSLARDRLTGAVVAIKQHAPGTEAARERLLREANIGRRIAHPNVVRVLDVDEHPGSDAIVMEYIPGGNLQTRLDQGPVPRSQAIALWYDVLAGLGAIHAADIVHRDVKPSNVLLTDEGRAKLADFGIARAVTEETLGPGGPVGTPLYMAPEVLQGREPTVQSDLYSATAVAYRMLTGRHHIQVEGADAWAALLERRGRRAALPVKGLPQWVNALLARGLAEDPRGRPASAGEMLQELEAHLGPDRAGQATSSLSRP